MPDVDLLVCVLLLEGLCEFVYFENILPQMPVVPLQRPEEVHIPNPSWMQTTSGYDDLNDEQGVPTLISWTHDGKEVAVEGSWDNWKSRL